MNLLLQLVKVVKDMIHGLSDRMLLEEIVTLFQIAYACVLRHKKLPFVYAQLACEHIQKGCFACAVSSYDAYLIAGIHVKRGFVYDYVCSVNF